MEIKGFRYAVLATVSATALMLLVERGMAADVPDCVENDRWWGSIEGQYLLYGGDSARYGIEGLDPTFRLKPDDGWGVGAEIGFQPSCSPWSFLGRVRYGESNKDSDDAIITYDGGEIDGFAEADHREKHIIADLEIGRDVGLGALGDGSNFRLFGGLRFAHFKGNGTFLTYDNQYTFADIDVRRTFTGIGPRIGFDAMVPLAEQLSLDLGAAGALLFGKQKFKADGAYPSYFYPGGEIEDKRSKSVVVPNLEATAALGWLVTDNAKFSVGYRVDAYFNVYDNGLIFGSRDEGDRILHGPFIKLTIGLGGDGG